MNLTIEVTDDLMAALTEALAAKLGPSIGSRDGYIPAEVAKRLDVSRATVNRRIMAGLIPIIPNITPARIPADYVSQMMQKQTLNG